MKKSKYLNIKVKSILGVFDSKGELERYNKLLLLEKTGNIKNLERQVRIVLIKGFKRGVKKYQDITYIADFTYFDVESNANVIEDYKSEFTRKGDKAYPIKKKLLLLTLDERTIFREVVKNNKGIIVYDL